jgi:D-alanyl-D-alanine carboxypeptidase (penicillin-binding protein 5/6)
MRLISVVMGSHSFAGREGASTALLNYGYTFYDTKLVVKGGTVLASTHVWKADHTPIEVGIKDDLYLTLPRGQADVKADADLQPRLIAPLPADATVGTLRVSAGNQLLASPPLHPLKAVAAGSWWRRLIDTIRLWFA